MLASVTGLPFSGFNLWINLVLIAAGFLRLGRVFGVRTVYVTLCTALSFSVLEWMLPISAPLTDQPVLEAVVVTISVAYMAAQLFQCGACSGGTDIVAMILRKYTKMNIGKALLIVDMTAVICSFFLYDVSIGLFSCVGLFAKVFVIDNVLDSVNLCKYFTIISKHPGPICDYIRTNINRGATVYQAQGNYIGETQTVILTVVSRSQAIRLRNFVHHNAPNSFMVITNSSEIVGRGFLIE